MNTFMTAKQYVSSWILMAFLLTSANNAANSVSHSSIAEQTNHWNTLRSLVWGIENKLYSQASKDIALQKALLQLDYPRIEFWLKNGAQFMEHYECADGAITRIDKLLILLISIPDNDLRQAELSNLLAIYGIEEIDIQLIINKKELAKELANLRKARKIFYEQINNFRLLESDITQRLTGQELITFIRFINELTASENINKLIAKK